MDSKQCQGLVDRTELSRLGAKNQGSVAKCSGTLTPTATEILSLEVHKHAADRRLSELEHELFRKVIESLRMTAQRRLEHRVDVFATQRYKCEPRCERYGWPQ